MKVNKQSAIRELCHILFNVSCHKGIKEELCICEEHQNGFECVEESVLDFVRSSVYEKIQNDRSNLHRRIAKELLNGVGELDYSKRMKVIKSIRDKTGASFLEAKSALNFWV